MFDAVALDYPSVTVLLDATAAATPKIHLGKGILVFSNQVPYSQFLLI